MKKQLFIITLVSLFSSVAIAADLYVRDLGAGGSYSTISAAITAAVDGDRIIIKPKSGNVPYLENITINKSLTFVSETNFNRYYVQGTILITPAVNRVVTINNMYAFQSSISTSSTTITGGRCTINIINSKADNNFDFDNAKNVSSNIFGSECLILYLVHGEVAGNNCGRINITSDIAPLATSDVFIIGNISGRLESSTSTYAVNILNNDINDPTGNPLVISDLKASSTNFIQNNRVVSTSYNTVQVLLSSTIPNGTIVLNNNILNTGASSGSVNKINVNTNNITVIANNNISSTSFVTTGVDILNNNLGNSSYTLDLNAQTATGSIVNGGLTDEEFYDLDLTINDVGPLGGSNSWANYWPINPGNKPRISFLNTPRRIYTGTTEMNATGSGYSK